METHLVHFLSGYAGIPDFLFSCAGFLYAVAAVNGLRFLWWTLFCIVQLRWNPHFGALARGEQSFSHREYKGTPPKNGQPAVSRVLSVAVKGENVYVELKSGPGKLTPTGAITPNGPAKVEVNVTFKLYEARRMGAAVLAYLHAWDVLRMMANKQTVSAPTPYHLVPATSDAIEREAHEQMKTEHAVQPAAGTRQHGRPVTNMVNATAVTSRIKGRLLNR